ncbi:MAG TPA: PDGLE domain-containing protein, partial [Nocardioidaceae bacterium]
MRTRTFLVVGFLVALLLAGVVSYYASGSPDGLNRVAQDNGFAHTARRHQ